MTTISIVEEIHIECPTPPGLGGTSLPITVSIRHKRGEALKGNAGVGITFPRTITVDDLISIGDALHSLKTKSEMAAKEQV